MKAQALQDSSMSSYMANLLLMARGKIVWETEIVQVVSGLQVELCPNGYAQRRGNCKSVSAE